MFVTFKRDYYANANKLFREGEQIDVSAQRAAELVAIDAVTVDSPNEAAGEVKLLNGALVSADGNVLVPPILVSDSPPNNADGYPNGTLYFYAGA